jgi:hypothetical protein
MIQIAHEHEKKLSLLNDELPLVESGLDSLGFAVLVARLEDQLGANPFTMSEDVGFPVTIGDFIGLYEDDARDARSLLQQASLRD